MSALDTAAAAIARILEGLPLEARVARMEYAPTGEAMLASLNKEDLARKIMGTLQVVALLRVDAADRLFVRGLGMRGHTLGAPLERTAEVIAENADVLALADGIWAERLDELRFERAFADWLARLFESTLKATRHVYEHRLQWEDNKPPSRRDVGRRISSGFPILEATAFNASAARVRIRKPLLAEFE